MNTRDYDEGDPFHDDNYKCRIQRVWPLVRDENEIDEREVAASLIPRPSTGMGLGHCSYVACATCMRLHRTRIGFGDPEYHALPLWASHLLTSRHLHKCTTAACIMTLRLL